MRLLTFLTVVTLFAISVGAQNAGIMPLVLKNYSGTGAVNATFDLSIYWDVREREEKKAGELLTAPGDRFKVTLGKEIFVSDGQTYWQYSERNSQVVVRDFSDIDVSTLPSQILSSALSNRKFDEKNRGDGTVELRWNTGGAETKDGFKSITAIVEEKGGVIKILKMTDGNDNIHTYTFKKTTFDKPPKNDVFQFKTPRGVETVDMRGE